MATSTTAGVERWRREVEAVAAPMAAGLAWPRSDAAATRDSASPRPPPLPQSPSQEQEQARPPPSPRRCGPRHRRVPFLATEAPTEAAAVEVETSPADEITANEAAPEAAADADQGNTATEEASPEELVVEEASPAEPVVEEQTPEASNEPNIDAKDEHAPAAAPPPADAAVWTRRGRGAGGRPDQRKSSGAPKSGDQSGVAGKPGNRQPPADRAGRQAKPGGGKGKGSRPPKNNAGGKPRREADKPMDPNSPFAVLAQLKK